MFVLYPSYFLAHIIILEYLAHFDNINYFKKFRLEEEDYKAPKKIDSSPI